jgi:hypothetical protein
MAKDESWRGGHLISAKGANRRKEATRMVNVIHNAKRRAEGAPAAGAKKHREMMKATLGEIAKK